MPIIHIEVSSERSDALTKTIATEVALLTVKILRKKPELIASLIRYAAPQDWTIAGQSLKDHGLHSFFLSIKITDETNTKDEKSQYIAAVFKLFEKLLGPLHSESYVHVEDVRATAYGYGGQTQEARYTAPLHTRSTCAP